MVKKIGIIGAGPAGSALACLLSRQNFEVSLFDIGSRPELLVGESLIPSTISTLRKLGIEEEVSKIGVYKPGAVFYLKDGYEWMLPFDTISSLDCTYAYNVNRKKFDSVLLNLAISSRVKYKEEKVGIDYDRSSDLISLKSSEVSGCDYYIDCSGRARLFSRKMNLDTIQGPRKDKVLFSHLDNAYIKYPGNIHINVFKYGWLWRIPLQDVVSVGIVACDDYFDQFGSTKEEQYDQILKQNPAISSHVEKSSRVSPVKLYDNYQLRSKKFYGKNWALVGDSAGFIDPIFSSGLHVALYGAKELAEQVSVDGFSENTFSKYSKKIEAEFLLWETVVNSFYEGEFFSMIRAGQNEKLMKKLSSINSEIVDVISRAIMGYAGLDIKTHELYKLIVSHTKKMTKHHEDYALPKSKNDMHA